MQHQDQEETESMVTMQKAITGSCSKIHRLKGILLYDSSLHVPCHILTLRMYCHFFTLEFVELFPDKGFVFWAESSPGLVRSSVIVLTLNNFRIVSKCSETSTMTHLQRLLLNIIIKAAWEKLSIIIQPRSFHADWWGCRINEVWLYICTHAQARYVDLDLDLELAV